MTYRGTHKKPSGPKQPTMPGAEAKEAKAAKEAKEGHVAIKPLANPQQLFYNWPAIVIRWIHVPCVPTLGSMG